jgi:hypothetical protein
MSGHEDERALDKKKDGYGWPDQKWIDEARKYACVHPIGGKCVCVHEFYQGTVKCSEEFRTNHKESHIQRLKRMLKTRCLGAR